MSSALVTDHRLRFDEYTSRLPAGYYVQSQYHHRVSDVSAGTDCRTFSDAASCDSSLSPAYLAHACTSCAASVELSKAPADADTADGLLPSHHIQRHHHQQQQQQQATPASFAIHQLLGLGAGDIRSLDVCRGYDRGQLELDTHARTTLCRCADYTAAVQSFNYAHVDESSSCLGLPRRGGSRHQQLDLSYCSDRSASVIACYRQHHGSTTPLGGATTTTWPYLPELPTPWPSDEPQLTRKTVHHHHHHHLQQEEEEAPASQHRYNELQAYCAAARLHQPRDVDVTSYSNVIKQCHINYLPSNLGM